MCIAPIPQEYLENMKKFQYKSTDDSLLYNKCMSPCLNKVVSYLPMCLAPNLITLFSLTCNIIAASITFHDAQFDFTQPLMRSTCIIQGITQFCYQILDNLDGKQARRTGTSSPFGMLLDHGCDIFTNCFTAFNMSHLLLVGNTNFFAFCVFFGLIIGFFTMTYEELQVGELHFAMINGTDEGNLGLSLLCIFCGFAGQEWLQTTIVGSLTLGQLFGLIVLFGGFSCVFNTFLHVYQHHGFKKMMTIPLDWIFFYNVVCYPSILVSVNPIFFMKHGWLPILISCLLFARETMDIQIKIVTNDRLRCNIFITCINLMINCSFLIFNDRYKFLYLGVIAVMLATELMMFIILRSRQITEFLGIKIFTIIPNPQNVNVV